MSTPVPVSSRPTLKVAIQILRDAELPTEDLTESHVEHFFYAGSPDKPTGLVGLEVFGEVALLRSLAVVPERRGFGVGQQLLAHAEREAWARGVRTIFLLTTTAEIFFSKYGYAPASREAAPAAIRSTKEFAGICPASSAFMAKQL